MANSRSQIAILRDSFAEETFKDLQETREELQMLTASKDKADFRGARTIVRAAISGTIKTMNFTVGEVVNSGSVIAEIVPNGDVVVEAKLPVAEVGYVFEGQAVQIMLNGADGARFTHITGIVRRISPDVIQGKDGSVFYRVTIEPETDAFQNKQNARIQYPLRPGLQVNNMIIVGRRSILSYLIDPILGGTQMAFVER